jgi:hypothetical protein
MAKDGSGLAAPRLEGEEAAGERRRIVAIGTSSRSHAMKFCAMPEMVLNRRTAGTLCDSRT